jgi:hypothetical protein
MDTKKLISSLAGLGLILTNTSCEKQEANPTNEKNQDIIMKSLQQNLGYTPLYSVEIPLEVQEQMIALAKLANDVFRDPSIAEAFTQDPQGYLTSIGLSSCSLDLNSAEVKAILALGDKDIRQAVIDSDLPKYVRLLHEKNYLNWGSSYNNYIYQNLLEQCFVNVPELKQELERLGVGYLPYIATYYILFVEPAVMIHIVGSDNKDLKVLANPVIKIWGTENNPNDNVYVINEIIEHQIEQIIEVLKYIAQCQNKEIKATNVELRSYLRKPITQQLIDYNLL